MTTPQRSVLSIRAGHSALRQLQSDGFHAADIGILPGAAGGPKAIGITGLDQAIFEWLAAAPRSRELIGASIGAWRMVCAMQADPSQAFARLAASYCDTRFTSRDRATITRQTREMLQDIFGAGRPEDLLQHPHYRLSLLLAQSRGLLKHESNAVQGAGLLYAVALNTLARPLLSQAFTRVICHDPRSQLTLPLNDGITTRRLALSANNLHAALMGTVAIPGVLHGSRIESESGALFRDGGLTDYHLDLPFAPNSSLTLYPHFGERIIPGWFDKFLPWRQADPARQANTILIAPSRDYLARLPFGKLPDRSDFKRFATDEKQRQRYWRFASAESQRLGDAFRELAYNGRMAELARPLFAPQ